jgi:arsenate reductase
MVTIYHNPRCGKSRGALALLEEQHVAHNVRLYLSDPLQEAELTALLKKLSMKAYDLVRKSEALYKEQYKDKTLSEQEWIKVLAKNPILIERPIVVNGEKAVIARPVELVNEVL